MLKTKEVLDCWKRENTVASSYKLCSAKELLLTILDWSRLQREFSLRVGAMESLWLRR